MAWNTVVKADELAEGKRMTHILREDGVEKPIILTNKNGNFYAVSAVCSHKDGYLPNGQSDGSCIICPFHGGKFDLCTGKSMVKINPAAGVRIRSRMPVIEKDFMNFRRTIK